MFDKLVEMKEEVMCSSYWVFFKSVFPNIHRLLYFKAHMRVTQRIVETALDLEVVLFPKFPHQKG